MNRFPLPPGVLHEGDSPESAFVREMKAVLKRYEGVNTAAAKRALVEEMRRIGLEYLRFDRPRKKARVTRGRQTTPYRGDFDGKAAAAGMDRE